MSNRHINATLELKLAPRQKLLLLVLANHACDDCGLAWPGVSCLARETGLGATSLREDLQALTDAGLLEIRRYPRGGAGRATEYIVLGSLIELGHAPCATCAENLAAPRPRRTHHTGDGKGSRLPTTRVVGSPVENAGVIHIPTGKGPSTHHPGGDQPSVEPEPTARAHTRTRERQAVAAPPHARSRPPTAPASVGDTLRSLLPGLTVSGALDAIPIGPAVAATPADREEPQGARQHQAGAGGCRSPGDPPGRGETGETMAWAASAPKREGGT